LDPEIFGFPVHTPECDFEKSSRASIFQIENFQLVGLFNSSEHVGMCSKNEVTCRTPSKQDETRYRIENSQKQKGMEENAYLDVENAFIFEWEVFFISVLKLNCSTLWYL